MTELDTRATLATLDRAFREGHLQLASPPTRFYFNLTERCSLRCRHCITRAPQRTADGSARDLAPAVLEALRPHLRHAAYVGFPHAGEPLLSPALEPLLGALQAARAGQPTVVHLLTNGLALSEDRLARLAPLGVNSISISLDGMSAATNDALRLGAQVERLLPRVRALSGLRRREFPDVRVGVAWTVTRSNIGEIADLLAFAAEAGLDWIKLEEVFPINPDAAAEVCEPERLRDALASARREAARLGVPLLEHVFAQPVWKCGLAADPEMDRFSRLDDRVNRMEINGCRLPWELVCIEPDGEVKPVSFEHPAAGNLLERDLLDLWNSEAFIRTRGESMGARPCGPGPVTCPADGGPEAW